MRTGALGKQTPQVEIRKLRAKTGLASIFCFYIKDDPQFSLQTV
jgi:hypothetical protein